MADKEKVVLDTDGLAVAPGMLTVYNFDPETGLFIGVSEEYLSKGVGIPAHSTIDAPPVAANGRVSVFTVGGWKEVADHRGEKVWRTSTGETVMITSPGDYPAGTTPLRPATEFDKWSGEAWVTDAVAQKTAAVKAAETRKSDLIREVREVTQVWQTQLMLGIITDEDKAVLTQWMKYYQQVQAVDTGKAPDVEWPQRPA